jgi:integrase/recombinase XerD
MSKINVSIFFDTRHEKSNDTCSIKLSIYNSEIQKKKLYSTGYEATKDEFKEIWNWNESKPDKNAPKTDKNAPKIDKKKCKQVKLELQRLELKANDIVNSLTYFTFDDFERLFLHKVSNSKQDVVYYYKREIEQYKQDKKHGTASNYQCSINSLLRFHNKQSLDFATINPAWLKKYENWILGNNQSISTVGIYLRPLRAIFNTAIFDKTINPDMYPFSRIKKDKKYQIPTGQNVKKALKAEQLRILFDAEPDNPHQQKAKDFFFFSYSCNGMNMKDIALLKNKDLQNDTFSFYRAKTINTRNERKLIQVVLNDYTKSIIERYRTSNKSPNSYLFGIISETDTPEQQHMKIQNFTRFVNQHIKTLAENNGLPSEISTYWARHSFASILVNNGASIEFIRQALDHSDPKTTTNYIASLPDEYKREMAIKVMDFLT